MKVGDIVRLKSSERPTMVVSNKKDTLNRFECTWFSTGGKVYTHKFHEKILKSI